MMTGGAFDRTIFANVAHRPWPLPERPWIMTQTWHDLLFAHWPLDVQTLRPRVPPAFELDTYGGSAWIGIVPFRMTNVVPRGVPSLPWISAFAELNVRTYVRAGGRPGVYFFSLDAGRWLAVQAARALFNLPYFSAGFAVRSRAGLIEYDCRRSGGAAAARLSAAYRPVGPPFEPMEGTLDYFLTERYCLYNVARGGRPYRLEIHHPPWPLQAADASFAENTMASAAGLRLPARPPLLHFARRQDMVAWAPSPL